MNDLQAKLDRANNMLQMLQNQRNAAQNECVTLGAELIAAQRRIQELEGKSKDDDEPELPLSNGHYSVEARP